VRPGRGGWLRARPLPTSLVATRTRPPTPHALARQWRPAVDGARLASRVAGMAGGRGDGREGVRKGTFQEPPANYQRDAAAAAAAAAGACGRSQPPPLLCRRVGRPPWQARARAASRCPLDSAAAVARASHTRRNWMKTGDKRGDHAVCRSCVCPCATPSVGACGHATLTTEWHAWEVGWVPRTTPRPSPLRASD